MKKRFIYLILGIFTCFSISYGDIGDKSLGIVLDEDFKKVGVSIENIDRAKAIMEKTSHEFKKLSLERQALEIRVSQLMLDGAEKNIDKLDEVFDKLGAIEASFYKQRVKSQVEMFKHISQEEYTKARAVAIARMQEEQRKSQKTDKKN